MPSQALRETLDGATTPLHTGAKEMEHGQNWKFYNHYSILAQWIAWAFSCLIRLENTFKLVKKIEISQDLLLCES